MITSRNFYSPFELCLLLHDALPELSCSYGTVATRRRKGWLRVGLTNLMFLVLVGFTMLRAEVDLIDGPDRVIPFGLTCEVKARTDRLWLLTD